MVCRGKGIHEGGEAWWGGIHPTLLHKCTGKNGGGVGSVYKGVGKGRELGKVVGTGDHPTPPQQAHNTTSPPR